MVVAIVRRLQQLKPEHPIKLLEFRKSVSDLTWKDASIRVSLSALFEAVDALALEELNYYYRRRQTRAWISGFFRLTAWLSGTVGLLPLLAATKDPWFVASSEYGYVALAISASCLAANALFGGTTGHVRFVGAQLAIEKIVTVSRISWYEYKSTSAFHTDPMAPKQVTAGFTRIRKYAEDLYATTIVETGQWAEMVMSALEKFRTKLDEKGK